MSESLRRVPQARLRLVAPTFTILVVDTIGLGWCYEARTHIAAPLILLFINGMMTIALMNMTQTLIIDLIPKQGASISACVRPCPSHAAERPLY